MKNLKKIRKEKKVTQAQLASAAGVNRATLSLYETGAQSPTVITALKSSKALGCTLDELLK